MVLSTVVRQSEEPAILYSPMACCISNKQVGGGPPTKDFSRVTSSPREVEEGGEREKGKDRHMNAAL